MISLKQLAQTFEEGLNAQLNNAEIKFKIWANAGEYQEPTRDGNRIQYFIIGNLLTSASSNDANALIMGVNGLNLEFSIPIKPPRTNAKQTESELSKIKDEQYPFISYVVDAINGYFERAKVLHLIDESGVDFTVSFQAGTVVPGAVDLAAQLGNNISVSAYVEVYFVEGGISSKNVTVYFDNSPIPFMAARYGRTPVIESDVYAGKLISKSIVTSSAFAIDVDFPLNTDNLTKAYINYLLQGEPNVAHFVNVIFGSEQQQLYLMTMNSVQSSAQGIAVAGGSVSFIEVAENAEVLNLPQNYQLGKFQLSSSQNQVITFTVSEECNAFIAGNAITMSGEQTIQVLPADIDVDDSDDEQINYYVYLITDKKITVTNSSVPFITVEG